MTPVVTASCLCPTDSTAQALAKINNNLVNLFYLMSAGEFTGHFVNLNNCRCSDAQVLSALNNNIVDFFAWTSVNGGQSGLVELDQNDASKAVLFPSAFGVAPIVIGVIAAPDSTGYVISASPDESTRSVAGVTFLFGASIPAAGYKLMWFARAA